MAKKSVSFSDIAAQTKVAKTHAFVQAAPKPEKAAVGTKTKRLAINLTDDKHHAFNLLATKRRTTMSALVEAFIDAELAADSESE